MDAADDWRLDASCRGKPVDWWFETNPAREKYRLAIKYCQVCPVRTQCLEWAMSQDVYTLHGIWAGTSKNQRIQIKERNAPRAWTFQDEEDLAAAVHLGLDRAWMCTKFDRTDKAIKHKLAELRTAGRL